MEESNKKIVSKLKMFVFYLIIAILISIGLIFFLAVVLCYTNVSEKNVNSAIILIILFSNLIGSFLMEKRTKEKGLVYGGMFGCLYMFLLYFISSMLNNDYSIRFRVNCYDNIWDNWWNDWWDYRS